MTAAEHVKIVNDVSLSQRPTLPAARGKARRVLCIIFLVLAHIVFYTPLFQTIKGFWV